MSEDLDLFLGFDCFCYWAKRAFFFDGFGRHEVGICMNFVA